MRLRGDYLGLGRDFPIMEREYEDPRGHWSPEWLVVGAVGGAALMLVLIVFLWLIH